MFRDWFHSILNLFYPRVCAACGEPLLKDEETVCLKCRYLLPKTGYELNPDNPLAQTFYGRVKFHAVTACFFFAKSGKVQHLIHELKYKGNKEAGVFLGQQLGETIKEAPLFQGIDYLIPVPLHPLRRWTRGYNQAEEIACGVAAALGVPPEPALLRRSRYTKTQTRLHGAAKTKNVQGAFRVDPGRAAALQAAGVRHVLLIDDVLTSGSTLAACAAPLTKAGFRVACATLAFAGT